MKQKYEPAKVVSRSGGGQNITFKKSVLYLFAGTLVIFILFNKFADDAPSEPVPIAKPVTAKKPSLSPAEAIAMEKKNKSEIERLIAAEKRLEPSNYQGRAIFWYQITALAPGNAEYLEKQQQAKGLASGADYA